MTLYRTRQGDVVDQIAKAELGDERHLGLILNANPGLAAAGPVLPEGLLIVIPEAPAAPTAEVIRLFGSLS